MATSLIIACSVLGSCSAAGQAGETPQVSFAKQHCVRPARPNMAWWGLSWYSKHARLGAAPACPSHTAGMPRPEKQGLVVGD
jgi:hypothetical protein